MEESKQSQVHFWQLLIYYKDGSCSCSMQKQEKHQNKISTEDHSYHMKLSWLQLMSLTFQI
jgi:hypothetical protein